MPNSTSIRGSASDSRAGGSPASTTKGHAAREGSTKERRRGVLGTRKGASEYFIKSNYTLGCRPAAGCDNPLSAASTLSLRAATLALLRLSRAWWARANPGSLALSRPYCRARSVRTHCSLHPSNSAKLYLYLSQNRRRSTRQVVLVVGVPFVLHKDTCTLTPACTLGRDQRQLPLGVQGPKG